MKQSLFFLTRFSLLVLLIGVVGCSFSRKKPDYLESESLPPIKVPEELDDRRIGQLYRLPEQEIIVPSSFKVPFPPAGSALASERGATLQKLDDKLWILNDTTVAKTWVQLINFLTDRNVSLAKTDLENAVLQTNWFNEGLQPGFSIRYRLRLERGFQTNTTEIYLTNQKRDSSNLISEWSGQDKTIGDDSIHGQLIADALLKYLTGGQSNVGNSLLAESISLPEKSKLILVNNEPALSIEFGGGSSRIYQALSNALVTDGFLVYDKDTANGFFHFDTYEVDQKKRRLLGLVRSKETIQKEKIIANKKSRHSLEKIIERLPNKPSINTFFFKGKNRPNVSRLSGVPGFLLVVKLADNGHTIYVRDGYGKVLKTDDAKELLDEIRLRLF